MLSEATINSLCILVDSAIEQTQQLFQILEKEQQALLAEDNDSLEKLIEQKFRISQTLDNVERQRQELMLKAGQNTDHASMQDFLMAHQQHRTIKPLNNSWHQLLAALKKASDQNHVNGLLLEKQRQHVKRALNILFEQSNSPAVYDATGGTTPPKYTRSVGVV